MSAIEIDDDGDEQVFVSVNGEVVYTTNHDEHGWDGMTGVIEAVVAIGNALNFEVVNTQDIV